MAHDELTERLDAFAAATLTPDPAAMARIRGELVVLAARQREAERRRGSLFTRAVAPFAAWLGGRGLAGSPVRLRTAKRLAYLAGVFVVGASMAYGTTAATGPGAPLYEPRIWLESAMLPASGPERAARELPLLEARLSEIRSAADRGDSEALEAAIHAYQSTADDAAANAATDDDTIAQTLTKHVAVLQGILGQTGGNSESAIRAAIQRAIDKIEAGQGTGADGHGQPPADGTGTGNGAGAGPSNGTGGGGDQNGAGSGDGAGAGPSGGDGNGNGAGNGDGAGQGQGGGKPSSEPTQDHGRQDHPTPRPPSH